MTFMKHEFYENWQGGDMNIQQVKVCDSDKFAIPMFADQIPTVFRSSM